MTAVWGAPLRGSLRCEARRSQTWKPPDRRTGTLLAAPVPLPDFHVWSGEDFSHRPHLDRVAKLRACETVTSVASHRSAIFPVSRQRSSFRLKSGLTIDVLLPRRARAWYRARWLLAGVGVAEPPGSPCPAIGCCARAARPTRPALQPADKRPHQPAQRARALVIKLGWTRTQAPSVWSAR